MPIGTTAGVALGAVFGFILFITCILSAIKAVRDRKKIKKKISERERCIILAKNGKCISSIEETLRQEASPSIKNKPIENCNGQKTKDSLHYTTDKHREADNVINVRSGVDNLTFAHSYSDIKKTNNVCDNANQSKCSTAEMDPSRNTHARSTRSVSNDVVERRALKYLPHECLAVKKLLRRHSYDMAVFEHSWLPVDPPIFQTSNKIIKTYTSDRLNTNTSRIGFENRAFDTEYYNHT